MVCECEEHVQLRVVEWRRHVPCALSSRRLKGAWPFITKVLVDTKYLIQICDVTMIAGESESVFADIMAMLARMVSEIKLRFGYMALIPWAFARADSIEGAQEVLRQVGLRPLDDHDHLPKVLMTEIGMDIERRAAGAEATQELVDVVARICNTPLDESCGEDRGRRDRSSSACQDSGN